MSATARVPAILIATRSEGKRRELLPLLAPLGSRLLTLDDAGIAPDPGEDAIEAHATFEDNAVAKARWFHERSGLPCIADDSGLAVDALGGMPGVRSKRWSGRGDLDGAALDGANNAMLLSALAAADAAGQRGRGARYVCVGAYVDDEREVVRRGETIGFIVEEPRGSGGFGYDPYFWSPELGATFGEATMEAKAEVSHRGRAMRALCNALLSMGE
ncbi:MAG TPA: non-canonical purine NTP pyrophosphatase [Gemmatimonadaceae bacterium]|nr:non-canonical purine NTP pyrophosphatase [Gemmatimonadaceae bacterium]